MCVWTEQAALQRWQVRPLEDRLGWLGNLCRAGGEQRADRRGSPDLEESTCADGNPVRAVECGTRGRVLSSFLGHLHVQQVLLGSRSESGFHVLASCSPTPLSPGQDQLELELVLQGSYEDTQTSVLGTASAVRFHYLAAQETELSGRLRVGLGSGAPSVTHLPCVRPGLLWPRRSPLVRH